MSVGKKQMRVRSFFEFETKIVKLNDINTQIFLRMKPGDNEPDFLRNILMRN